ncbi:hypothetical protein V6N12_064588 [Hibiscus sabdariffa]|uniref:Uncharacterized protein n=1 Tax=Hibiscus sabdariffa TaxID=183260 RepID=A0ABR2G6R3_9ROSI
MTEILPIAAGKGTHKSTEANERTFKFGKEEMLAIVAQSPSHSTENPIESPTENAIESPIENPTTIPDNSSIPENSNTIPDNPIENATENSSIPDIVISHVHPSTVRRST